MSKLDELQNVLHVYLTEDDCKYIEEYWRAFYDNPEQFKDDVLCDMILQDLGMEPIKDWEHDASKEETESMIELSEIVSGYSDVKRMHYTPDDTLAWGHLHNMPFYMRRVPTQVVPIKLDCRPETFSGLGNDGAYAAVTYISRSDAIVLVVDTTISSKLGDDIYIEDYKPDGYEYAGAVYLGDGVRDSNIDRMIFTRNVYVPFNNGPYDSLIPILWKVQEGFDGGSPIMPVIDCKALVSDSEVSLLAINNLFYVIKKHFPSIDNPTNNDDRYVSITIDTETGHEIYVYNRNHVAYNGNVDKLEAMLPILLGRLVEVYNNIKDCNIGEYLNGFITKEDLVISFNTSDNGMETEELQISEEPIATRKKSNIVFSDNPLIRAAQMIGNTDG